MALDPEQNAAALVPVRKALNALWKRNAPLFHSLFTEERQITLQIGDSDRAGFAVLAGAGLVEETAIGWQGLHRLRVVDGVATRFYALGLGDGVGEYRQDLWPETDALLAVITGSTTVGDVLDIGTGCGILAVEAALLGHRVLATDLHERTLTLARWNARLNAAEVELVCGHLWDPVGDKRFDLVVIAPHYGHYFDQLRLEVIAGSLDHLRPNGRFVLASQLEWEGPSDEPGAMGITAALQPLEDRGANCRVRPILDGRKRTWCTVPDPPRRPLVARHRFTVTIENTPGPLEVVWPPPDQQLHVAVVPLSRLQLGGRQATGSIESAEDLAALETQLSSLASLDATLSALPAMLLDACRFGARVCVGQGGVVGAAGAILDSAGGVRACTHGDRYATVSDTFSVVSERLQTMRAAAEQRRGCAECPAASECSRCLYPAVTDEKSYCDLIRRHRAALPTWFRLIALFAGKPPSVPFRLRRWPRPTPPPVCANRELAAIQTGWLARQTWIVELEGKEPMLVWLEQGRGVVRLHVPAEVATDAAHIADGTPSSNIDSATRHTLTSLFVD